MSEDGRRVAAIAAMRSPPELPHGRPTLPVLPVLRGTVRSVTLPVGHEI